MPDSKFFHVPAWSKCSRSRWAIHYCSKEKTAREVKLDLELDGVHVLASVEKRMVSRDSFGRVCFDRVLLIEVPAADDYKLYFPEKDQACGRYAEWPYCLDAYQFADFYVPGQALWDDAAMYDRKVQAQIRYRVANAPQRLILAM